MVKNKQIVVKIYEFVWVVVKIYESCLGTYTLSPRPSFRVRRIIGNSGQF